MYLVMYYKSNAKVGGTDSCTEEWKMLELVAKAKAQGLTPFVLWRGVPVQLPLDPPLAPPICQAHAFDRETGACRKCGTEFGTPWSEEETA